LPLPGSPTTSALTALAANRSSRLFKSIMAGEIMVGSGHTGAEHLS
jgi:hypothetical protein